MTDAGEEPETGDTTSREPGPPDLQQRVQLIGDRSKEKLIHLVLAAG